MADNPVVLKVTEGMPYIEGTIYDLDSEPTQEWMNDHTPAQGAVFRWTNTSKDHLVVHPSDDEYLDGSWSGLGNFFACVLAVLIPIGLVVWGLYEFVYKVLVYGMPK
jgi:hypothetical protein